MDINERIYFNNLLNYKPRGVKKIPYQETQEDIYSFACKIRSIAKDALSEEISVKKAKKEISDLLENIKELKKGGK